MLCSRIALRMRCTRNCFSSGSISSASANGFGGLLDVVRIHQQSVAQFARGSGELAQDQYAAFVAARGEELLGHQVHTVVQRGHQAEIGGAIVAFNLLVAMVPLEKTMGFHLLV